MKSTKKQSLKMPWVSKWAAIGMIRPPMLMSRLCHTIAAFVALLILVLAGLPLASAQDADPRRRTAPPDGLRENVPQTFALTGADLMVRPGEMIEDGTLLIRDGRIIAVGNDVEIPEDAKEIDVSGKRIYAGFIDAWAELPAEQTALDPSRNGASAANYWNDNVTPQIEASRVLRLDPRQHEALRKAGFVARVYAPSAGILKGTAALVSTAEDATGENAVLMPRVGLAAQLTVSRGPGRTAGYPSSPMGAVALARQAMYDAQWFSQAQTASTEDGTLPRPERNDALVALQSVVAGDLPVWISVGDELYALRADRYGKEFDVDVVLVGSGDEYRRADLIAETGRPMVLPVNFPKPPDVSTPERADSVDLDALMDWDLSPSNPAMMTQRGVKIAFSTTGLQRVEREFHPNLKKAIGRGLSGDAALAALTTDAAEIIGATDLLGSLEAGKTASFVITDGDLFTKDSKSKILEVWVDGVRDVIVRDPVVDLRGGWKADDFNFTITGTPDKLAGTVGRRGDGSPGAQSRQRREGRREDAAATSPSTQPATQPSTQPASRPAQVRLRNVRQSADNLSFTVTAAVFGQSGVASVTLTNLDGVLYGTALLPDGTKLNLVAERTAPPSTGPTTEPAEGEIEAEPAVGGEGADEIPTEAEGEPGTAAVADESEQDPEGTVEIETTPSTGPADVAKADENNEPLFPVNYPLGAFGRETAEAPEAVTIVLTNATIWTSGPQGKIENGTVVVSDGKIVAVGGADEIDIPEGATEFDASGKHITPGIIDAHTHIATDGGVNEGSQNVTAEVRIADFVDPDDIDIYRQLAGGVTAANILHGSANPIGGQNQVIKFRWGQGPEALKFKEAPAGVKFALGENVKRGSNYPSSRMGVQEIIGDSFRAALDYQRAKADFEANGGLPVRVDLELEALVEMLEGTRLIHCHSYRQDEILATLRTFDAFGIKMASLQHILEGYKVADEMAAHGVGASTFSDWWAYKMEVYDAIPYNGAIMHNAGVNVSFNSDDGELARRLNTEAAKAVKYGGVPEAEALKFVTLNPAMQLGIDEYVGSLEAGKHADLVVWSGSPLSTMSVAEQTWVDGRKYFDRAEDQEAKALVREMRAKLIQRILASGEPAAGPDEANRAGGRPSDNWADVDIYCHGDHLLHDHADE